MNSFNFHSGIVIPLDRSNVDTDAIIPKQFLKSIKRTGFGPNLFDDWRYLDPGEPGMDNSVRKINPEFILNKTEYKNGSILLARENFGCGSSREHAPWAILDFGIKAIIAESFADIFYGNCFKNGILPITLKKEMIDQLFTLAKTKVLELAIDLPSQTITLEKECFSSFEIDGFKKHCLINGLDDIGLTLEKKQLIESFEEKYFKNYSWLGTK
jgi:3-isopropylmalate/(R)-2-methylmalate dehydratase small subunit